MESTILIRNARAIVTCDGQDRVYYDSDMLIQGPKIVRSERISRTLTIRRSMLPTSLSIPALSTRTTTFSRPLYEISKPLIIPT